MAAEKKDDFLILQEADYESPSCSSSGHDRALLNISGSRFELLWSLIDAQRLTRLQTLHKNHTDHCNGCEIVCDGYDKERDEFFFQRDPVVFTSVLNFYQTGKIHIPRSVCVEHFQNEIEYWGIHLKDVDDCCHHHFQQETEVVDNMRKIKTVFKKNIAKAQSYHRRMTLIPKGGWYKLRTRLWDLFENPKSSRAAKVCRRSIVTTVYYCKLKN